MSKPDRTAEYVAAITEYCARYRVAHMFDKPREYVSPVGPTAFVSMYGYRTR